MCGRFSSTTPPEAMWQALRVLGDVVGSTVITPNYNAAPTQRLPVVVRGTDGVQLASMIWGLIPALSDGKPGYSTINARAETVDTKPAFRDAFRRRRCLVPADGFYEWMAVAKGSKQPYRITLADGSMFAMAGIWERWRPREASADEAIDSFAIIVGPPNDLVRPIHDRMPVILAPEDWAAWLDPAPPRRSFGRSRPSE